MVALFEAGDRQCRAFVSATDVCGQATAIGSSYCPTCRQKMFVGVKPIAMSAREIGRFYYGYAPAETDPSSVDPREVFDVGAA